MSVSVSAEIVEFDKGPGNSNGGIFVAFTDEFCTFETFRLETGEALSMSIPYEYTVGTDIMFHGNGTVDPLDEETAFLYVQFVDGNIRDILGDPTLPEDELADAVQLAVWLLEEGRATDNADAIFLADYARRTRWTTGSGAASATCG